MKFSWFGALLPMLLAVPAASAELTPDSINMAAFTEGARPQATSDGPDPFVIRVQVLLDRAHMSPGAIDGVVGSNLKKAIRIFEESRDLPPDGEIDAEFWAVLQRDAAPAVQTYTITEQDRSNQFVEELPEDFAALAKMDWLGYRGAREMLAERFHVDEKLLEALNPGVDFSQAGKEIIVPALGSAATTRVARIVVRRDAGELLAFGEDDRLVASYPATIGSDDNPTPSGLHKVKGIARNPTYTYNPDLNFKQGKNTEKLVLPAGPNGPVGLVWIDLTEPTYGIHGTPDPVLVGKVPSHGCVRLSNWDALELADLVKPGVPVEFK
jgi:lipoprotein-anchoring transpeptidase ErfK/SrfK